MGSCGEAADSSRLVQARQLVTQISSRSEGFTWNVRSSLLRDHRVGTGKGTYLVDDVVCTGVLVLTLLPNSSSPTYVVKPTPPP